MKRTLRSPSLLLAVLLFGPSLTWAAPVVFGESAMVKVQPSMPARADTGVRLIAARNEFVSFQVVVHGADTGASGVTASLPSLSGPDTIDGTDVTLYREDFLNITRPTHPNTSTGPWPDPLIPDRDEIAGEQRRAFPFGVPPGEARAIWVDVHVPTQAPPGTYRGEVQVTGAGLDGRVPVTLEVVDVLMPSTPSLATAFRLDWTDVCTAHGRPYQCGTRAQALELVQRYSRMALEHRMTLTNPWVWMPTTDWREFDAVWGPFIDGTVATRLPGAKLTTLQYIGPREAASYTTFTNHFREMGWLDRAFSYTADEPPYGVSFEETLRRAQEVRRGAPDLPNLITITTQEAEAHNLIPLLDIITPVVNWMDGTASPYLGDQRSRYDAFLAMPGRKLWMYQSCMSHGCTGPVSTNRPGSAWPSYMVDASATRNRAMQWIDFRERVSGELYWETAHAITTGWTDVFRYNGNGDGTLFYAGTPARIGGNTDVPVASIRMKQIRLGIQDYEWLKMVSDAGDPTFARDVAMSVFPSAHEVGDDGTVLERARERLIFRLLELNGSPLPPSSSEGSIPPPEMGPPAVGCSTTGAAPMLFGLLALLGLGRRLVLARAHRASRRS